VKDRLITLAFALGALALCYALFLPKSPDAAQAVPRPLSTESGPTGYLAAWTWLQGEHVPVRAFREHYDALNRRGRPGSTTGNVLLTTLPHDGPLGPGEAAQLDAWVERGNTLLVAAAFDDTPAWAFADGARLQRETERLARFKFEVVNPEKGGAGALPVAALAPAPTLVIEPRGEHPLLSGVHSLQAMSDLPASRWRAVPMDNSAVLAVGRVSDVEDAAIWVRREGDGQVILFAVAGLFSNRDIGSRDNARLLANAVAWALGPGGTVMFDDGHQGAVNYYDAKAFFADPRLHRTVAWLVLLWFVFVLGAQQFRRRGNAWHPVDVTAFVATSGEFLASALTPVAAGSRLLANFFNAIRHRLRLREDGAPVWEWLSSQARVRAEDVQELRDFEERIRSGGRIDLLRLQNVLSRVQGNIT
jgi:hypothetical protein